ncbi:MAG: ExsB family protein [Thermotogaceae bacterium]|nr:ExsB family protein [Thermotogaceae bacterium]
MDKVINDIREIVGDGELVVAFSGGEDSSLVALLSKLALGKDKVVLAHIDWGMYEYEKLRSIVKKFAADHDLKLHIIDGAGKQKDAWRFGPSCNSCTKFIKLRLLRDFARSRIVATGSNQYDTWGRTGIKIKDRFYAPLWFLSKEEIREMLDYLSVDVGKIGESEEREGCKLKHLLKMLVAENFHGRAVAESNEILLKYLEKNNIKTKKAAVKIIGPLSKNIAAVVVEPPLDDKMKGELEYELKKVKEISEVVFPDENSEVVVVAAPPVYKNEEARKNIEGYISIPGKYRWILSKNAKLRTFQVVEIS